MYSHIVVGYFRNVGWEVGVGERSIRIGDGVRQEMYYEDSWNKTLARIRSLGFFGEGLIGIIVYDKYGRVVKTIGG